LLGVWLAAAVFGGPWGGASWIAHAATLDLNGLVVTLPAAPFFTTPYLTGSNVALIFEGSDRGDTLVRRDFDLATMGLRNVLGRRVEVEGVFMRKELMEPGLEVADLIAHTAGRQRRHELRGKDGHVPDFQQTYWHSTIPPEFIAINSMQIAEAVEAGSAVPRRDAK
jgi:hypothetical protein